MKISVLLPTYGRYSVLREAITYFLLQTYQDKELIILSDAATPIVGSSTLPSNIKIINSEPLPSLGHCWEAAYKACSGDYIFFWSDDDTWLPWALTTAAEWVAAPTKGASIKPEKTWVVFWGAPSLTLESNMFEGSVLYPRSVIDKFKFKYTFGAELTDIYYGAEQKMQMIKALPYCCAVFGGTMPHVSMWIGVWKSWQEQRRRHRKAYEDRGDFGDGKTPITPVSVAHRYKFIYDLCEGPKALDSIRAQQLRKELTPYLKG